VPTEPRLPADELAEVFGAGAGVASEQLHAPVASASRGIWRVRASGRTAVLKVVGHSEEGNPKWHSGEDPAHWYYWRREVLAYESGMLDGLAGGLRAARCHLVAPRADGTVALWLEDLGQPAGDRWPLPRYGAAARHLGRAQGRFVTGRSLPDEPWLGRDFLRAYVTQHDGDLELLADPACWRAPPVAALFETPPIAALQAMRQDQPALLDALDGLPRTLCHQDFHPLNLFAEGPSGHGTVAIDWSFVGIGAIGEGVATLVADALLDFHVVPADAEDLYETVVAGYLAGLTEAGWDGDEATVRFAMSAAMPSTTPGSPAPCSAPWPRAARN
jgi:hypothetical protein